MVLLDIRRFRTIPIPGVILTKCRDIANFYLIAFYSATVGVGLYVVLAKDSLDRATVAVAVGLALLCALPSILPQLVFYRFLRDANLAQAAVAERLYRAAFLARGDPGPGAGGPRPDLDPAAELALWTSILEVAAPSRVWIYDYGQVFLLLLAQIIALAATLGTVYLRDIVPIE